MPSIAAMVKSGPFFFKDAPHWHYSSKRTLLLEEIITYESGLPEELSEVVDVTIKNSGNVEVPYGYGSTYGAEYGGINITGNDKIEITPVLGNGEVANLLSSTSYVEIDAWFESVYPERVVNTFTIGTGDIVVDFTHPEATANSFGFESLSAGEVKTLLLTNQSIYDTEGALKTPAGGEFYTYGADTNTYVALSTIQAAHASSDPIQVEVSDSDVIGFVRNGDTLWLTAQITAVDIDTQADLPAIATVSHEYAFKITGILDPNFGKYMIPKADRSGYSVFDDLPRSGDVNMAFKLVEDPGNPGNMTNGNNIFIEPLDWANGSFFAAGTEDTELIQYYFERYQGIPKDLSFDVNRVEVVVDVIAGDTLTASSTAIDNWTTVAGAYGADQMAMATGLDVASGLTASLRGIGKNYVENYILFLHEMEKVIKLPDDFKNHGPVVITDMLSTPIDPEGTCNIEFKVDSERNIVLNKSNNLIANPSFYVHDSQNLIPGWSSFEVDIEKGENGVNCYIHEKSAKMNINSYSYLRQRVSGINSEMPHSLSLFGKATDSSISVKVYGFVGGYNTSDPSLDAADQVIEFDAVSLSSSWERFVARIKNLENIKETDETPFPYTAGSPIAFIDGVTEAIIEIKKESGTSSAYIDAVQFEEGYNPKDFSSSYDLAVVEYEGSEELYAPRLKVSPIDKAENTGYAVLSLEDGTINDIGPVREAIVPYFRDKVIEKYRVRPWAKLKGVDKYKQTSKFSSKREKHRGEHFLYPELAPARYLSFLGEPLTASMKSVEFDTQSTPLYLAVEDDNNRNLSSRVVTISFGNEEGSVNSSKDYITSEMGVVEFSAPDVYVENACPILTAGVDESADFNLGYTMPTVNTINKADVATGQLLRLFNRKGEYAPMQTVDSSTGTSITYSPASVNDWGSTIDASEAEFGLPIPSVAGVPDGYVLFNSNLLYNASLENHANAVISYVSGVNNIDVQYRCYQKDNATKRVTFSKLAEEDDGRMRASFSGTEFNPIRSTIVIKDTDAPTKTFRQVSSDDHSPNGFFVDYQTRNIYIYDLRAENLEISFIQHPFFVPEWDQKQIFVHVNTLMGVIQNISSGIDISELSGQHLDDYGSLSPTTVEALNYPLLLRLFFFPETYITAQHRDLVSPTRIIHRHTRPIL